MHTTVQYCTVLTDSYLPMLKLKIKKYAQAYM